MRRIKLLFVFTKDLIKNTNLQTRCWQRFRVFQFYTEKNALLQKMVGLRRLTPPAPNIYGPIKYIIVCPNYNYRLPTFSVERQKQSSRGAL